MKIYSAQIIAAVGLLGSLIIYEENFLGSLIIYEEKIFWIVMWSILFFIISICNSIAEFKEASRK